MKPLMVFVLCAAAWAEQPLWRRAVVEAEGLQRQGKYAEAEAALLGARDSAAAENERALATLLNNLGSIYLDTGRCDEARRTYLRALHIWEKAGDAYRSELVRVAINLCTLYMECGDPAQAARLRREVIEPYAHLLPRDNPDYARMLVNAGYAEYARKRYAEAEELMTRALAVWERVGGPNHPQLAVCLNNLSVVEQKLGKQAAAEDHALRAYAILERIHGPGHPVLIRAMNNLGMLQYSLGRYQEADRLLRAALEAADAVLDRNSPVIGQILLNHGGVLRKLGRKAEARQVEARARAIAGEVRVASQRSVDISELSLMPKGR